ncbi:MAG: NTP transferase domain-containing protein [Candidatus Heimdallarchaeota archaeon]|nr:NTP transferase domain-containing protein [Candidatus Heimdallarchaeota archaeon]
MKNMKTVIIAAGKGTRMRPLTETRLKGSLLIQNQPLIRRLVELIHQAKMLDELILIVSPGQEEEMLDLFKNQPYSDRIKITTQDPPKGTADAVAQAEPFINKTDERLFVINGDILAPLTHLLPKLLDHHKQLGAICSMVVTPGVSDRYGLLKVTDGQVKDIQEKVATSPSKKTSEEEPGYINCGIYLFERAIFKAIKETPLSKRGEYEITDSIALLGRSAPIGAIKTDSWMSIENPVDLFYAQRFFTPSENQDMQFHSGIDIGFKAVQETFFQEGMELELSNVFFKGPVLVGQGALIEPGAQIGPNVWIGRDSIIESGSSITQSLIMENCRISANSIVNFMIAGEEVVIGSKVVTKKAAPSLREAKMERLDKPSLDICDFVVVGGKAIIASHVVLKKGIKIHAHEAIQKHSKQKKK